MRRSLEVYDHGGAPERTVLSWRRTALAIGVGSVLGARLLADTMGPAVFAVGLLGLAFAIAAHGGASAAYRRAARPNVAASDQVIASTTRLAGMTLSALVLAILATAYVLSGAS